MTLLTRGGLYLRGVIEVICRASRCSVLYLPRAPSKPAARIRHGHHGSLMVMPGLHYFSILGELSNPASPLYRAILHESGPRAL